MPKFSVKKPLTVFVAVVAVLVLGVVAYLRMTPDLLPNPPYPPLHKGGMAGAHRYPVRSTR